MNRHGLQIEDIQFAYRAGEPVLRGASCVFPAGELTALLGNNGSGKTTLLKILVGIYSPDAGSVRFEGRPVSQENRSRYQQQIGFMPESLLLYPEMRADAALAFLARLKRVDSGEVAGVLRRVGLEAHAAKKIRNLSKGMRQRLNLAQALLGEPRVIVLDEPSNGFDVEGVSIFYETVRDLLGRGVVAVLSSHLFAEIQGRVDRITLLSGGVIRKQGRIDELLDDLGAHTKAVWLYFEQPLSESDCAALCALSPGLQRLGEASLAGELDGQAVAGVLSAATSRRLRLRNIRVEGNELSSLMETSR
jgi:ABC-type multidrug transport system ATPase subunit